MNAARWAKAPHIRSGDPCYLCGAPMVPASRSQGEPPPGWARHGSHGLCRRCYRRKDHDPQVASLVEQARADD